MSDPVAPARGPVPSATSVATIARNLSTRYLAIATEAAVGLVLLPFNIASLGRATYGLWMLAASVTGYFSVLDLGYAGALTKFVAYYRARGDARAINEILSTLFFLFAGIGLLTVGAAVLVASFLGSIFSLTPADAAVGRTILVVVSLQVGCGFAFSVFGGVVNGFQRFDLNNLVGMATTLVVAALNLAVLSAGYGVVTLVVATTSVRLGALFVYRRNAYVVFPELHIAPSFVRLSRLREVTGFSVFVALLDWAAKINYALDAIVIGGFIGTVAVAMWTVSQRLAEAVQRLTNQLNDVLFPAVVDSHAASQSERLRTILLQGTRLSLATVLPVAVTAAMLAEPLLVGWVGAGNASVLVTRLLAAVVVARVGTATSMTILKGAGWHRLLAATNITTAAVNLAISVLLVRHLGLAGVAIGTLVPITAAGLTVIAPAACRRAGLPVTVLLREAVWPAAWPAAVLTGWLALAAPWVSPSLGVVAAHSMLAGAMYLVLFLRWGLPPAERRLYALKATALLTRVRHLEATT